MPTEAELREQFHEPHTPSDEIDLDAVLRRSRARRRPRVVAAAVGSSLAALAIVVPLSVGAALGQTGTMSATSGTSSTGEKAAAPAPSAVDNAAGQGGPAVDGGAAAQKVNLCTGALAELAPAPNGLVVTVDPVTAAASDRGIPVTVTLRNGGTTGFVGTSTPFPDITLSQDGVVLWHSNGAVPSLAQEIGLAAGASTTFRTTFEPLRCGAPDDERSSFRDELPAVGPGQYQLSAVLDVRAGDGSSVRVSGPTTEVTLH